MFKLVGFALVWGLAIAVFVIAFKQAKPLVKFANKKVAEMQTLSANLVKTKDDSVCRNCGAPLHPTDMKCSYCGYEQFKSFNVQEQITRN